MTLPATAWHARTTTAPAKFARMRIAKLERRRACDVLIASCYLHTVIAMSNGSKSTEVELEHIGGTIVAEVTREQLQEKIAALRDKLAAAMNASTKAAAADKAAMDAYLGLRSRRPKSAG